MARVEIQKEFSSRKSCVMESFISGSSNQWKAENE